MKTFIFLLVCTILCIHSCLGQTAEYFVQKADSLYHIFKYDSSAYYYSKASERFEQSEDWLQCEKNNRLTGCAMLKAGKCDSAWHYINKAGILSEKHFRGSNKEEIFEKADVFINMADVYEKKGKFFQQLINCKKALELIVEVDSFAKLRMAEIWNKMGLAYNNLENYDSALSFCEKALETRKTFLSYNDVSIANSYYSIGLVYIGKGEYGKALEFTNKALPVYVLTYGGDHPDVAKIYCNLGVIYEITGEYDKASDFYQKTQHILISVYGENHPDVARYIYTNLGSLYTAKQEYKKALEFSQKALEIFFSAYGENHPYVVNNYNDIGTIYEDLGEYNRALDFHQKALKIQVALYGENNLNVAYSYNNIGLIYEDTGEYDKALDFLLKALRIKIGIYGEKNADVASSYNNIGLIHEDKGEYDEALKFHQKALDILISVHGENHPDVARNYNNIGLIYKDKGEYDKAIGFLQKALNIKSIIYGENHPYKANNYNNIGLLYYRKGEYDKALEFLQKALALWNSVYGENHPLVSANYTNLGIIYSKKGETLIALQFFQKALCSDVVGFTDSSIYINPKLEKIISVPLLLTILTNKAYTFYQQSRNDTSAYKKDMNAALCTYELAFQLINSMRNEYNIENTKLLLSTTTKKFYAQALHVALEFDNLNPSNSNNKRLFEFMEKSKGATMSAGINEYKALHFAGIPDSLLKMEKELRIKIGDRIIQITAQKSQKQGYDTLMLNALENENFSYSRRLDSLITYFETTYPAYYEFKYSNDVASVNDIQEKLDNSTATLNYFVGDSSLFIAAITDSLYKIKEICIDNTLKKAVNEYYKSIKTAEPEVFLKYSTVLYQKLIRPIKDIISDKAHLVIIPDDYLYYVPFETIVENLSGKVVNNDFSKLNYLINSYSISYHHSATLWLGTGNKENKPFAKQKMNFIGFAPVFSKKQHNGLILSSNICVLDTTGSDKAYRSISSDLKNFNPLPYSGDEVTSIEHLFEKQGKEAKAYLYSDASESNFKANAYKYDIIHVSSHGFANDREPALSGIVFSQPRDTIDKEDGILYAGETYNLNLNADLVVLGSCESGLGKLIKGEGFQALSRGFLYVGAHNVMFSLWKTLDKPTKELMVQFYSNVLAGNTYTDALQQAKLKLIKSTGTAFPYFWSGFMLVGR